ncbi:MAG: ferredoxin--NADP(+) reductase, partial [Pseudomonadota bacterium]
MERQAEQAVGAGALSQTRALPIETDALVIGAGPVGLFQAFQLGLLEISCHIVDALPHAG